MHLDRLVDARRTIAVAVAADPHPGGRDEFVLRALEVGLARRADDTVALGRAWRATRDILLRVGVDLFTLLPLAELVIAAARVRETERVAAPLADAWRLLERLGDPPLWSAHLHWAKVQEAIITNSPALIAPHAAALVRAGAVSRTAAILADAGRSWVAVLGGGFDVADVEHAARGLASIGLVWDGGRLVGHAAAHAENRRDQSRLLASARALTPHAAEPTLEPVAPPTADTAQPPTEPIGIGSGLSARERQVARMVLEGKSYREIGEAIFISPRTVEHHMARMRQRLDADTRSQLLSALRDALEPAGHGGPHPEHPLTPLTPIP
jgi:DNA-binding CsgD family transcriptional regulator